MSFYLLDYKFSYNIIIVSQIFGCEHSIKFTNVKPKAFLLWSALNV